MSWWRKLLGMRPTDPSRLCLSEVEYVYVSKERAIAEARKLAGELMDDAATVRHFNEFAQDKLGWKLPDVLDDAIKTGEGRINGHVFGRIWPTDRRIFAAFSRALENAGFSCRFETHGSDGPEADNFSIVIKPMGGAK